MKLVEQHHLNRANAPLWIQSFELTNMQTLRTRYGYKANEVLPLASNTGAPYDLVAKGDPRTYADLMAPASLRRLSTWIDGIGPNKALVITRTSSGALGSPTGARRRRPPRGS